MTNTPSPPLANEVTVQLRTPIASLLADVPGGKVDKIVLSDATAGMWAHLDDLQGAKAEIAALAMMASMTPRDVGCMGARDFRNVQRAMGRFLSSAEVTVAEGETARTLPLVAPYDAPDGTHMTELKLREPLASDLEHWDSLQGVAKDLAAVTRITGLPEVTVRTMGIRDFRAAAGWIAHFFDDAPTAGA